MSKENNQVVFNQDTQEVKGNKKTAIKSVVVLVLIAVILGGILAILNDILYISDDDRLANIISTFYDNEKKEFDVITVAEADKVNQFGSIDSVYLIEDGNYLIKSTGYYGYKNGTVTLWLLAEFVEGNFNGFIKVRPDSYTGQTLMSNFTDEFYQRYIDGDITQGYYSTNPQDENYNVVAGTTKSSNAINNAVNSAYYYITTVLGSEEQRLVGFISSFYNNKRKNFTVVDVDIDNKTNQFGAIDNVYAIENGDYLIKSTGYYGFKNGTVTLWLLAQFKEGKFDGFSKIKLDSYTAQTYMANISDDFYQAYIGSDIKEGYFTTNPQDDNHNVVAGTTRSSNAINNAVNSAYYYISTVLEV